MKGRVAQRITRLTTDQKIAGSNPAVLENLFAHFKIILLKVLHCNNSPASNEVKVSVKDMIKASL